MSRRATLAEMAGRVDEAIEHADAAVKLGAAIGVPAGVEALAGGEAGGVLWGLSVGFVLGAVAAFARRRALWGFVLLTAALLAAPADLGVLG